MTDKTAQQLRAEIDAKCHEAKVYWDTCTKQAKAYEDEIRALEAELDKK